VWMLRQGGGEEGCAGGLARPGRGLASGHRERGVPACAWTWAGAATAAGSWALLCASRSVSLDQLEPLGGSVLGVEEGTMPWRESPMQRLQGESVRESERERVGEKERDGEGEGGVRGRGGGGREGGREGG